MSKPVYLNRNSILYLLYLLLDPSVSLLLVAETSASALLGVEIVDTSFAVNNTFVNGPFLFHSIHKAGR